LAQGLPILVVGGGIGGMAAAILLRRRGFAVNIVELDPEWRVYGAGISITGPTYRAFQWLGILDEVCALGFGSTGAIRIHNTAGQHLADVPTHSISPGLPSGGGIMRPVLHQLLRDRTGTEGVSVRLGITAEGFNDQADSVNAPITDGTATAYQAVIGADGAFSAVRAMLFPDAPEPRYTGQYCWRVNAARPPEVTQPYFFMAGQVTAGLMPVSPAKMYMWLLQPAVTKTRVAQTIFRGPCRRSWPRSAACWRRCGTGSTPIPSSPCVRAMPSCCPGPGIAAASC